jgi:polysaccharide export outer membrane protein
MGLRSHTRSARIPSHWTAALLAALLAAAGCLSAKPAPAPVAEIGSYRVGAPDQLSIAILPDPIVVENVTVRPDGKITLQLIGDVQAAGRSPQEIAADVEEQIGRYKRGARVTVALSSAQSSAVTVLGEVANPSAFPLVKLTRAAEALGIVGGPSWLANVDEIKVVRPSAAGTQVLPVDFAAIRDGDLRTNIALEGGDIIYVPPTVIGRIGYAVRALLFPFDPLLGVARSAAGTALVQ